MRYATGKLSLICAFSLALGAVGCTQRETRPQTRNMPPDNVVHTTAVNPDQDNTSLVITFEPGSSALSNSDRLNLTKLIQKSAYNDTRDRLEVAVWADRVPADGDDKLTNSEVQLAKDRIATINNYFKSTYDLADVKYYNMAQSTNWLAKTFNTRDAELKSIFAKNEGAAMADTDFQVIIANGAPSRAVLVITHKP